jgi:hypothetical protein
MTCARNFMPVLAIGDGKSDRFRAARIFMGPTFSQTEDGECDSFCNQCHPLQPGHVNLLAIVGLGSL